MAADFPCPCCQRLVPAEAHRCSCGSVLRCPQCGWHVSEPALTERRCFGDYLVRQGRISDDQLVAALDEQARQQEHFGHIAVRHGLLTANQLLAVLNAQLVSRERFGEVAVGLGFMTREQVGEVLELQRRGRPPVGEVLVRMGVITQVDVERMLIAHLGERSGGSPSEETHA